MRSRIEVVKNKPNILTIDDKVIKINREPWEDDEYIITLNDKRIGRTLSKRDADAIKGWFPQALKEFLEERDKYGI